MPLHYETFLKHQQEENHRAKKEAENLWSQYVESDRERDHLGPEWLLEGATVRDKAENQRLCPR